MVEKLQADLSAVTHQRTVADVAAASNGGVEPVGSRRNLLKLAGGAAIAATAGSLLLDGARPVAADSNQALIGGRANFVQDITYIRNATGTNGAPVGGSVLTSERTMFWADNRLSTLATAIGVRGDGRESGTGIDGSGVTGTGTTTGGIGIAGIGPRAALASSSGTGSQPPNRTDAHSAGEIDIDANGTTWLCVADGTPGTWRKLGGTNTAGALHAIDPVRAFDSRWPAVRVCQTG